jgi:hypothetical protein
MAHEFEDQLNTIIFLLGLLLLAVAFDPLPNWIPMAFGVLAVLFPIVQIVDDEAE